jgi:V/A-type H+-transporting ATPase subunit I
MRKFRAIFPQRVHEGVVARLHEAGVVQLKEITELELVRRMFEEEIRELSPLLAKLREAREFLGRPRARPTEVEQLAHGRIVRQAVKLMEKLEPKLTVMKEQAEALDRRRQELLARMEIIEIFREVEFSLNLLRSTDGIHITVGRLAEESVHEFCEAAREALEEKVLVIALGKGKERTIIAACRAKEKQKLSPVLYRYGIELLEVPAIPRTPLRARRELERELRKLDGELSDIEKKRAKLARTWAEKVCVSLELLEIQKERLEHTKLFGYTGATTVVEGWIPEKRTRELQRLLDTATDGRYVFRAYEPQRVEIESVPVELENPRVAKDFEFVTELYSLPKYDEVDPTPFLTLTFPLFFGICLSDAGYGLLLGLFMASGIWFAKAFPRKLRRTMVVCAVFTVAIGALMGGWFGTGPILWINPMENPIPLLKLAVFIGVLHIVWAFGIAGALKDAFKREWKNLFFNRISKVLMIFGFFGLCFSILGMGLHEFGVEFTFPKMELFAAFNPLGPAPFLVWIFRGLFYAGLGIGVVGAVVMAERAREKITGPVNVVYGITGLIADAASYSRLMALGIATGIIAFAINYIVGFFFSSAAQPLSAISPVLVVLPAIPLALLLFFAHCFNIFIQTLGAFIHTMRLHYVEFFGKFYEGGGEKFTPFKAKRVFTEVRGR